MRLLSGCMNCRWRKKGKREFCRPLFRDELSIQIIPL
jgi:hypothetical protein